MIRSSFQSVARVVALLIVLAVVATTGAADATREVSQKDRKFQPGAITLDHGDSIVFVNDDGDLIHHAYLADKAFSFDTGDQAPGSRTAVVFPVAGTFVVMCGIHPKMRLTVEVK